MKIVIIDNFDSFTFNLYQLVTQASLKLTSNKISVKVLRNNDLGLSKLSKSEIDHLIIGPGPGHPHKSGYCKLVLTKILGKVPVLGVCLGHQFLANYFGARIKKAISPMHGKTSLIRINSKQSILFKNLPDQLEICRYHSLVIDQKGLTPNFSITAYSPENEIMAIENIKEGLFGVQFHPESFLTQGGEAIIKNFLNYSL